MLEKKPQLKDSFLVFQEDGTILTNSSQDFILSPINQELLPLSKENYYCLGQYRGKNLYGVMSPSIEHKKNSLPVRDAIAIADKETAAKIFQAKQLLHWHQTTRYSGCCGEKTEPAPEEMAKVCPSCKRLLYPTYANITIVLITRGKELLLARSPHFAEGVYSAIAGFLNPGESFEEAAHREVKEELGLSLSSLTYFGSQPWPFPSSMATAFIATCKEGPIEIDPKEIEDARWFNIDNLPKLPHPCSLSRHLIDSYIKS